MKTDNALMAPSPGGAGLDEARIWETRTSPVRVATRLSLPSLLRGIGALVVVGAFLMYLFQGWRDGDQLTRTLILLAHTGVLTLAGFAAGHWLRETKGARLFIGLALVAVPVDFAFLGGITYGHLTWDPVGTASVASAWGPVLWEAQPGTALDPGSALGLAAAAVVALAIAIQLGFLVMARRSSWSLTGLYLLANGTLLIPTRSQGVISASLLVLAVTLILLSQGLRRRDPSLATPEGVFARAVLVLPLLVLGGRSIWLYAPDQVFVTSLAVLGYLGLRLALRSTDRGRGLLEWSAVLLAGLSAVLALSMLGGLHGVSDIWVLPLSAALLAGLLVDLSFVVPVHAGRYRNAAALVIALAMSANLAGLGGAGNAVACIALGLAGTVWGYLSRLRAVFAVGLLTALGGLGVGGRLALAGFTIGGWTAAVLAGIATIAAGSVVERYGERIKTGVVRWNRHFEPAD